MASLEQCRAAIDTVSNRIMEVDPADRRKHIAERRVSVTVTDLDTVFDMRLTEDGLQDITSRESEQSGKSGGAGGSGPRAQVRITVSSDDLVELAEDRLSFGTSMLSGRVKLDASFSDMMRLRKLL